MLKKGFPKFLSIVPQQPFSQGLLWHGHSVRSSSAGRKLHFEWRFFHIPNHSITEDYTSVTIISMLSFNHERPNLFYLINILIISDFYHHHTNVIIPPLKTKPVLPYNHTYHIIHLSSSQLCHQSTTEDQACFTL